MPITFVNYSRLYNLGNDENVRFEAEVNLAEGQTPEQGLAGAQARDYHQVRTLTDDRSSLGLAYLRCWGFPGNLTSRVGLLILMTSSHLRGCRASSGF